MFPAGVVTLFYFLKLLYGEYLRIKKMRSKIIPKLMNKIKHKIKHKITEFYKDWLFFDIICKTFFFIFLIYFSSIILAIILVILSFYLEDHLENFLKKLRIFKERVFLLLLDWYFYLIDNSENFFKKIKIFKERCNITLSNKYIIFHLYLTDFILFTFYFLELVYKLLKAPFLISTYRKLWLGYMLGLGVGYPPEEDWVVFSEKNFWRLYSYLFNEIKKTPKRTLDTLSWLILNLLYLI